MICFNCSDASKQTDKTFLNHKKLSILKLLKMTWENYLWVWGYKRFPGTLAMRRLPGVYRCKRNGGGGFSALTPFALCCLIAVIKLNRNGSQALASHDIEFSLNVISLFILFNIK